MDQAVAGEPLSRPYMGIHFVTITRQLADEQKLPVNVGALVGGFDANGNPVTGVEAGKPADLGGIKDGDIIVSINGKVIDEEHPLDATLAQFSPGDTVDVDDPARRQHVTLQVTLGTRPAGSLGRVRRPTAAGRGQTSASPHRLQRGSPGLTRRGGLGRREALRPRPWTRSSAAFRRGFRRRAADLDEFELPNRGSIVDGVERLRHAPLGIGRHDLDRDRWRPPSRPGSRRRAVAAAHDRARSSRAGRQRIGGSSDRWRTPCWIDRQTQHLAVSAWGVPQCGQRHIGMRGW